VSSTTLSFWCFASGTFSTLTVLCESPVKILYLVLLIAVREYRYMKRINLWPFGWDYLPSALQCSEWSPGLRFLSILAARSDSVQLCPSSWEPLWEALESSWHL
jgi:hypothetical protein